MSRLSDFLSGKWRGYDVAKEKQREVATRKLLDATIKRSYQNAKTPTAKKQLLSRAVENDRDKSMVRLDNGVFVAPRSQNNLSAFANSAATQIAYNNPLSPKAWANWYNSGREAIGTWTGNEGLRDAGTRGLAERRALESFNNAQAMDQRANFAGNAFGGVINAGTPLPIPTQRGVGFKISNTPSSSRVVNSLNSLPGRLAASSARYGASTAADTGFAIREAGGSETAQQAGSAATGVTATLMGAFGLGRLGQPNAGTLAGKQGLNQVLRNIAVSGNAEGMEELVEGGVDDLVARATYDKNRSIGQTLQNLGTAYGVGFASGGVLSGANARYGGKDGSKQLSKDKTAIKNSTKPPAETVKKIDYKIKQNTDKIALDLIPRLADAKAKGKQATVATLEKEIGAIEKENDFLNSRKNGQGGYLNLGSDDIDNTKLPQSPPQNKQSSQESSRSNTNPLESLKQEVPTEYLQEYADILKSMDDGARGGQMIPDGEGGYKRISEHSKHYSDFYKEKGRAPKSKNDWLEIARKEIVNDKDFLDYVQESKANQAETQSLEQQGSQFNQEGKIQNVFETPKTVEKPFVSFTEIAEGKATLPKKASNTKGNKQQVKTQVSSRSKAQQPNLSQERGTSLPYVAKSPKTGKATQELQSSKSETPSGELQRGFIKTVMEDANTSKKVKDSISSLYTRRNTKELQTKAANLVKDNPDLATRIANNGTDDVAIAVTMELVKKQQQDGNYEQAIQLVEKVSKTLTESGRASQAASMYARLTPEGVLRFTQKQINAYNRETGKEIKLSTTKAKQLKSMADNLAKMPEGYDKEIATQKLIKEIRETMPTTLPKKISTLQTMAQLLNPKTIIRNEVGNTIFLGIENISQTVATPVDTLLSLVTGKRTTTLPSVSTQVKGLVEGRKKGIKEGISGINTGPATQYDLNNVPAFKDKLFGTLEKTMGAALQGGDRANYTAAFNDSIRSQMKLAKTDTPTAEMTEIAHQQGLYRTFQDTNNVSGFFMGMKKTLNKLGFRSGKDTFGMGDLVLKYPKTPGNLLARAIDYSPGGFVKTVFEMSKPVIGRPFNQKAFVDSVSRASVGTAGLVGTGMILGALGIITEAPEDDKDLRDLQRDSGQGGYQINVSALKRFVLSGFNEDAAKLREGDYLVSYDWAQPAAIPVSTGAAIGKGRSAKEGAQKSVNAIAEGVNTIVEQPMVQGLQQFFNSNKGPVDILVDQAKNLPASFVPTASNQVRQLTDNTNRNPYDINPAKESLNRVMNRIPVLSKNVPERVTSLGDTRQNYQNGSNNIFNVALNPAFVNQYQPKDSAKLPLDIFRNSGETKQAPRSISTTQNVNGENIKITAQQNQDLQRFVGTTTDRVFNELSKSPEFMALNDTEKAKKMSAILTDINKAGKVLILGDAGYNTPEFDKSSLDKGVRDVLNGNINVSTKVTGTAETYKDKYESALRDFNDKDNGWSPVERAKKEKELRKLTVQKDYDNDTISLYGMSEADTYDFVSRAENGEELAQKLIAYDNALYEAGLTDYRKYSNGLKPSSTRSSSRSGGKKKSGFSIPEGFSLLPRGGSNSGSIADLVRNAKVVYRKS